MNYLGKSPHIPGGRAFLLRYQSRSSTAFREFFVWHEKGVEAWPQGCPSSGSAPGDPDPRAAGSSARVVAARGRRSRRPSRRQRRWGWPSRTVLERAARGCRAGRPDRLRQPRVLGHGATDRCFRGRRRLGKHAVRHARRHRAAIHGGSDAPEDGDPGAPPSSELVSEMADAAPARSTGAGSSAAAAHVQIMLVMTVRRPTFIAWHDGAAADGSWQVPTPRGYVRALDMRWACQPRESRLNLLSQYRLRGTPRVRLTNDANDK
jgi:hypothetical protein